MEVEKYEQALLEFLLLVDGLDVPRALTADRLRFPALEFSTLSGSAEGRGLWESPAARKLVEILLEDDNLKSWFSPDGGGPNPESRLTELRRYIASFVTGWAATDLSPAEMVEIHGALLLDCLKNPQLGCSKIQLLYGVSLDERMELPTGVNLEPATTESVREILAKWGASDRDLLRFPRDAAMIVTTSAAVTRENFGPFAATTAWAGAEVLVMQIREDIFLATGVYPRLGDGYTLDHSVIHAYPGERQPASTREMFPGATYPNQRLDPDLFRSIHLRMQALREWPPAFKDEHLDALWVASAFNHSSVETKDDLIRILLTHAAVEGLLVEKGGEKTRRVPRLAFLTQRDPQEGRMLKHTMIAWTEIRDAAAHGERPTDKLLGPFVGQVVRGPPPFFRAGDSTLWKLARARSDALYRRVFLAMLFCCVSVNASAAIQPKYERNQVLDILNRVTQGNRDALDELHRVVPQFVRDIEL